MLKLSIIVPVYNVEAYLGKCLDSLIGNNLSQEDYEIILVNDGSTDSSGAIAEQYASRNSNIQLINQKNQGLGGARNTGIKLADGNYIMFVDSDDYVEKNSFAALLKCAEDQDLDVLRYNHEEVDESYEIIPKKKNATHAVVFKDDVINGKTYLSERMGWACYVCVYLFRSEFIKSGNYLFEKNIYFEDVEWLPRVLIHANRVSSIDKYVYNYLQREGSITKSPNKEKTEKLYHDQGLVIDTIKGLIDSEKDPGVICWAKGFIALTVISRISIVVAHFPEQKNEAIRELKKKKIFPLQAFNFTSKQKLYTALINISPKLFLFLKSI